ncbi:MAG: bifunctional UDP-N-acetylglucosamine diphosphorylase/glucosamine-1-phosphate N-acetyltransferase GlmU [Acetobacteraceae bacterium]
MSETAIILAAGLGTRMRASVPKAMLMLAGKPLIWHLVQSAGAAFERIVVVIGPEMPELAEIAAPHAVVVQEERLGTAHAAAAAAEQFGDGPVAVLYVDNPLIRPETLSALVGRLGGGGPALALLAMRPPRPDGYGLVVLDGAPRIVEWAEASAAERAGSLCNAGGLCAFGPDLRRWLSGVDKNNAKQEYYLTDIVALAATEGARIEAVEGPFEELRGINTRSELAAAEASLQARLRAAALAGGATLTAPETVFLAADTRLGPDVTVGPYVVFGPGVAVEQGAEIRSFSHLEGCHVGAGAQVGPFARIRRGSRLGEGARVGNFVELKATELGAGAKANHLAYLGDAAIGEASNIGAGTITCNYDGFAKHRTEIGAHAFIGSDAVLVAPVTVGAGAFVAAGSVITKDVAPDAMAFGRAEQKARAEGAKKFRDRKKSAQVKRNGPCAGS